MTNFTFFDLIETLLKHWKVIFWNTLIVVVAAIVVVFILPQWYSAKVKILPPSSSRAPAMGGLSQLIGGAAFSLEGGTQFALPMMMTMSDLWRAMVNSRAIIDSVIYEYDLERRYDRETLFATRKEFEDHLVTEISEEGVLSIIFEDKDPAFAAEIANRLGDRLDELNMNIRVESARRTKDFIAEQLNQCQMNLSKAEKELGEFQRQHKTILIEDQVKVLIQNLAELKGQLLVNRVKLNILKKSYFQNHAEIKRLESAISSLGEKINQIESDDQIEREDFSYSLQEIPELTQEYVSLFRDVRVQEALYEFLIQQYEQAKIEEQKDTPTLHFLERATPPERRSRPQRKLIVIAATLLAFCLVSLIVVTREVINKHSENYPEQYGNIKVYLNNILDYFHLRKRRE